MGLQLGYTKYCCFICEWDSHAKESHYCRQSWPLWKKLVPGQKSVVHEPLVKGMDKEGKGLLFPRITEDRTDVPKNKGIFVDM